MTIEEYLALEAVSASDIVTLLQRCPRAACYESWLNPERPEEKSTRNQDIGSLAHALLMEGDNSTMEIIDPGDYPSKEGVVPVGWTNNAIREARDAAYAEGKIPILLGQVNAVRDMVEEARFFIEDLRESEPFIWAAFEKGGGDSEVTITWQDGLTPCKIRPDRISDDKAVVIHYKTGGSSAEPNSWGKGQFVRMGCYVTAAFYARGIRAVHGTDAKQIFLVQENEPPYLCSLVGLDPAAEDLGNRKVEAGLKLWAECDAKNDWPGYPERVCYPEIPAWEQAEWEGRE